MLISDRYAGEHKLCGLVMTGDAGGVVVIVTWTAVRLVLSQPFAVWLA
jgi:hypothetical protein